MGGGKIQVPNSNERPTDFKRGFHGYEKTFRSPWFDYLMVSQEEMQAIVAGTGWKVNRFLAN